MKTKINKRTYNTEKSDLVLTFFENGTGNQWQRKEFYLSDLLTNHYKQRELFSYYTVNGEIQSDLIDSRFEVRNELIDIINNYPDIMCERGNIKYIDYQKYITTKCYRVENQSLLTTILFSYTR